MQRKPGHTTQLESKNSSELWASSYCASYFVDYRQGKQNLLGLYSSATNELLASLNLDHNVNAATISDCQTLTIACSHFCKCVDKNRCDRSSPIRLIFHFDISTIDNPKLLSNTELRSPKITSIAPRGDGENFFLADAEGNIRCLNIRTNKELIIKAQVTQMSYLFMHGDNLNFFNGVLHLSHYSLETIYPAKAFHKILGETCGTPDPVSEIVRSYLPLRLFKPALKEDKQATTALGLTKNADP